MKGKNPSHFQEGETSNFPVENVSWDDALDFIEKLNQLYPELKARLPWEAEWEYACRARTETPFNFAGKLTLNNVNYRGTLDDYDEWEKGAKQATSEVKCYAANVWGLYEVHGNVWAWCEDIWREDLEDEELTGSQVSDRRGQIELGERGEYVLRGSSWNDCGRNVHSSMRFRG